MTKCISLNRTYTYVDHEGIAHEVQAQVTFDWNKKTKVVQTARGFCGLASTLEEAEDLARAKHTQA